MQAHFDDILALQIKQGNNLLNYKYGKIRQRPSRSNRWCIAHEKEINFVLVVIVDTVNFVFLFSSSSSTTSSTLIE